MEETDAFIYYRHKGVAITLYTVIQLTLEVHLQLHLSGMITPKENGAKVTPELSVIFGTTE